MGRQNLLGPDKLYRLSLVDNDTHDVVKVMLISRMRATLIAIASVIGIILLIYSIIAFTPLRSTIPGYPDAHSKKVALANAIKIDSLENIIKGLGLSTFSDAFTFVLLIIILVVKPTGLFGEKTTDKV